MIVIFEDIRKVRPLAENLNDEKRVLPYIEEAELFDVLPVIGADLYKQLDEVDLKTAKGTIITNNLGDRIQIKLEFYDELMDGCYFNQRCGNAKSKSEGLRKAIAYFTYSRFILQNQVNATAFGFVWKKTEYSEKVDDKTLIRVSNDARKKGEVILHQVVEYLKVEKIICDMKENRIYRSKIKAIGR